MNFKETLVGKICVRNYGFCNHNLNSELRASFPGQDIGAVQMSGGRAPTFPCPLGEQVSLSRPVLECVQRSDSFDTRIPFTLGAAKATYRAVAA